MNVHDIFSNLPRLESERLLLRRIRMEDVNDVFEYSRDPEVSRYMGWQAHRTIDDAREFVNFVIGQYMNGDVAPWGIVLKETQKLIGTIGYVYWLTEHKRAEVGYAIGRQWWGKGLMPEAVNLVLEFGFKTMNLHRIEARCEPPNAASQRVIEKVGMKYEGLLRDHMYAKGSFRDLKLYSILYQEWLTQKNENS